MRAEVKVAAVRDSFQLAEFPGVEEREGILDVGRAAGVVRQLVGRVVAELQLLVGDPKLMYQL